MTGLAAGSILIALAALFARQWQVAFVAAWVGIFCGAVVLASSKRRDARPLPTMHRRVAARRMLRG